MNEPRNDLERELTQALRRKEPSAGFVARVVANLPLERPSRWSFWMRQPAFRWAASIAVLVAIVAGSIAYRHHQQELARGRAARQQLILALRITGTKLQLAQQRVAQIGADHNLASQQTEKTQ